MKGKMRTAGVAAASVLGLLAFPLTGLPRTVAPAVAAPLHGHGAQYAPYFETWTKDSVAAVAAKSGARRLTLAFIQSEGKTGAAACTIAWNGSKKQPISAGRYLKQIARLRRSGGNVIPSFGGYSADQ